MPALTILQQIRTTLTRAQADASALDSSPVSIFQQLDELTASVQALETNIRDASDVCKAFTVVTTLLDTAYERKVEADHLRCLLGPLTAKLERATESMTLLI